MAILQDARAYRIKQLQVGDVISLDSMGALIKASLSAPLLSVPKGRLLFEFRVLEQYILSYGSCGLLKARTAPLSLDYLLDNLEIRLNRIALKENAGDRISLIVVWLRRVFERRALGKARMHVRRSNSPANLHSCQCARQGQ